MMLRQMKANEIRVVGGGGNFFREFISGLKGWRRTFLWLPRAKDTLLICGGVRGGKPCVQ